MAAHSSTETPTVRTATYARVSTADQSPDLQHDGLRAFAHRAGLSVVAAYTDVAVSGRKEGRPDLDRLMASARRRELDCVLVWKFDRFARSVSHLVRALDEFDHLGVRFVSVQDDVDTTSPMGRAMFAVIGAMAELESALIAERVQAGMAAAKARGRHVGRPATNGDVAARVEELARTTDLSVRKIHAAIADERGGEAGVSRSVVGRIVKEIRADVSSPS
ncbi:recombinase family protein [Rubricoccus marinus]|uniref:Resolvase n=1 Tax=Rubricoccus marinus TaxID=716817 RepID=A0A259TUP0_9BACT|nr:recombinase family protein [Rubricoccus marinus]OZC01475.1 resolvase [Rubricoccus marinus]